VSQREPERAGQRARESQREPERAKIDKKRQLTEENAHQEMVIAENGPVLVHATPLLTRALDKYFLNETKSSDWHFFSTDENRFNLTEASKTIKRLQSEQSRLSFMDK
jgi:hypothetical protein